MESAGHKKQHQIRLKALQFYNGREDQSTLWMFYINKLCPYHFDAMWGTLLLHRPDVPFQSVD